MNDKHEQRTHLVRNCLHGSIRRAEGFTAIDGGANASTGSIAHQIVSRKSKPVKGALIVKRIPRYLPSGLPGFTAMLCVVLVIRVTS